MKSILEERHMKICVGCGVILQDKDAFCWKCGAIIQKKKKTVKDKLETIKVIPL